MASQTTVNVECGRRGRWQVALPGRQQPVVCDTLDDAIRIGYSSARRQRGCELVVRDAYNRVVRREVIAGDDAASES
jgi:hypothetical protein